MTDTGRWSCTALSVLAGGVSHPAHSPDHDLPQSPAGPQTPTCPHAGAMGFANPAAPMVAPLQKGCQALGLSRGNQGRGGAEAGLLCQEDRSQGTVMHAQHLSPVDTGIFFSWENTAKKPPRGLPSPLRHCWCRASHTSKDSPVLVPWASHSCKDRTAQLAAELPEDPSPRPPLMEKMQFPPLETSGTGRGEQGDIPNALLQ